jgi:dihydropteroate synthase
MHAQGSPTTMQEKPVYRDVVREVGDFFRSGWVGLNEMGIAAGAGRAGSRHRFWQERWSIIWQLLAGLQMFYALAAAAADWRFAQIVHRKIIGADVNERLPASLACAILAVRRRRAHHPRARRGGNGAGGADGGSDLFPQKKCGLTLNPAGGPRGDFHPRGG